MNRGVHTKRALQRFRTTTDFDVIEESRSRRPAVPDLVVDLSKPYMQNKLAAAFLSATNCTLYKEDISFLGSTWYLELAKLGDIDLRTGNPKKKTVQPGLKEIELNEIFADLNFTVTLTNPTDLKKTKTKELSVDLTLTVELDVTIDATGNIEFSAQYHSLTFTLAGASVPQDIESLIQNAFSNITESLDVVSFSGINDAPTGTAIGLLSDGTIRIGVGLSDATKLLTSDMLRARWIALWSSNLGPTCVLKKGEDWSVLITTAAMWQMARTELSSRAAELKAKNVNVSGLSSVSWDAASARITVEADAEFEVPFCSDLNLWLEWKSTFTMKNPPELKTSICTDAGLTSGGKVEAVGCGFLAFNFAHHMKGPLGDLGTIVGAVVAGEYGNEKVDANTGCKEEPKTVAKSGFSATRIAPMSEGLFFVGTATKGTVGTPAISVTPPTGWIHPRCYGASYASVKVENPSTVPLRICKCETYPSFPLGIDTGYADVLPPGGTTFIAAHGSGVLIIRTTGGTRSVAIPPYEKETFPVSIIAVGTGRGGKVIFKAARGEPIPWACKGLKDVNKKFKLSLVKKPIPPVQVPSGGLIPYERWLAPVAAPHRSMVVWDAALESPSEGFRLGFISANEEREIELASGEALGEAFQLNVGISPDASLELLVEPPEQIARGRESSLRIWRAAITRTTEVAASATMLDVAAAGSRVIGVDGEGLLEIDRAELGSVEHPVMTQFERLLEIDGIGDVAAMRIVGSWGYLALGDRFLVLDLSRDATTVIGDCGLDGARAMAIRNRSAIIATESGLVAVDITDPHRPGITAVHETRSSGPVRFQGDGVYLADETRLTRFAIRDELTELGAIELDGEIEQLGGYGSNLYATAGGTTRVLDLRERSNLRIVGVHREPHWSTGLHRVGDDYWRLEGETAVVHELVPSTFDVAALDLAAELARR